MQTIVICGLLFIYCAQARMYDAYAQYTDDERKCIEDLELDVNKLNAAFGAISQIEVGNEQANKFMECAWKGDFMTEDGEVLFEKLLPGVSHQAYKLFEHPPDSNKRFLDKVTEDCKDVKGIDHGDTAVKIHNCINDHFIHG